MFGGSRCTAALLASVTLVAPALAQQRPPTDKDKRIAGDLVKKAIAKSQAGDHAAAIATYLQAYAIVPNSVLLSNIGSEYQQEGKPEEALRYFCMYLERDPTGTNAPYASQQARQLQSQLGHEDEALCAPRKRAAKQRPRAPVEDDAETAPPEPSEQPAPDKPGARGGGTLRYAGIAAGVAGLAGLGLGLYAGLEAQQISDEISAHDPSQPWSNIKDLEQRGQRYENLQIAGLVAGGALVTGGVILFLVGRSSGTQDRDQTAVRLAPTRNGLAVFGRF